MKALLLLLSFLMVGLASNASAQTGEIFGTVYDEENKAVANATVFALVDGIQRAYTATDFDGNYSIKPLALESHYTILANYIGHEATSVEGVYFDSTRTAKVDFQLKLSPRPESAAPRQSPLAKRPIWDCGPIRHVPRYKPLVEPKMPGSRTILEARDLEKMPY